MSPISPSVVSTAVFLASALLLSLAPQTLHKDLSEYTLFTIVIAILAFIMGEIAARLSFESTKSPQHTHWLKPINISGRLFLAIIAFSFFTLSWSYQSIKEMATAVGYREGENLLIQYGRLAILQNDMRPDMLLTILGFLLRAISYILTYVYLYNKILTRRKTKIRTLLLLPSLIYLIQYMLWGSRGGVIEYISFYIFVYAFFKSRVAKNNRIFNIEVLSLAFKGITLFVLIFVAAGSLKGWAESNPLEVVATYGGGSLSALDIFLNSPKINTSSFGQETFLGVYSLLERIGISSVSSSRILEFTTIGQSEITNIYTSIRRYVSDYGFFGMIYIQFILGYLFSAGFLHLQRSKRFGYFLLFYSMLFMAIIYQALDEQALTTLFSTTQVFTILFTYILYRLFLRRKTNIRDTPITENIKS